MAAETYGVANASPTGSFPAPALQYRPPHPTSPERLPIGVIGCGGIAQSHLAACRNGGFFVAALCDRSLAKAEARRAEFFPAASVTNNYRELLARSDLAVIDITTHPEKRPQLIEEALRAGKHVLSQKPFVLELAEGARLAALAETLGLKLAVNQNGRWAPHFSYMREAVRAGLVGEVSTVDFTVHWDHHWILDTPFNSVEHLIFQDFAIHWFDMAATFCAHARPLSVYAAARRSSSQRARPPLLAHAVVDYPTGQASFAFNADCPFGQEDRTAVIGSLGTVRSAGLGLDKQQVTLSTREGVASPDLVGSWFPDGFQGAMGELLCAIEEDREPLHSARDNLRTLSLCFAAVESARRGAPVFFGDPAT